MAPEETRYLTIAAVVVIITPLALAAYVYWFLITTYAQQRAVQAAREHVRVLDIKIREH